METEHFPASMLSCGAVREMEGKNGRPEWFSTLLMGGEMIAAGLVLKNDVWGFSMSDQARAYFERLMASPSASEQERVTEP